jgi:hypothetical protein
MTSARPLRFRSLFNKLDAGAGTEEDLRHHSHALSSFLYLQQPPSTGTGPAGATAAMRDVVTTALGITREAADALCAAWSEESVSRVVSGQLGGADDKLAEMRRFLFDERRCLVECVVLLFRVRADVADPRNAIARAALDEMLAHGALEQNAVARLRELTMSGSAMGDDAEARVRLEAALAEVLVWVHFDADTAAMGRVGKLCEVLQGCAYGTSQTPPLQLATIREGARRDLAHFGGVCSVAVLAALGFSGRLCATRDETTQPTQEEFAMLRTFENDIVAGLWIAKPVLPHTAPLLLAWALIADTANRATGTTGAFDVAQAAQLALGARPFEYLLSFVRSLPSEDRNRGVYHWVIFDFVSAVLRRSQIGAFPDKAELIALVCELLSGMEDLGTVFWQRESAGVFFDTLRMWFPADFQFVRLLQALASSEQNALQVVRDLSNFFAFGMRFPVVESWFQRLLPTAEFPGCRSYRSLVALPLPGAELPAAHAGDQCPLFAVPQDTPGRIIDEGPNQQSTRLSQVPLRGASQTRQW